MNRLTVLFSIPVGWPANNFGWKNEPPPPRCNSEEKAVLFPCNYRPLSLCSPVTILSPLPYISLSLCLSPSIAPPLLAPNNERISIGLCSRQRRKEYDLLRH